jgi:hypothetical protein
MLFTAVLDSAFDELEKKCGYYYVSVSVRVIALTSSD